MLDPDLLVSAVTILVGAAIATLAVFFFLLATDALWHLVVQAHRRRRSRAAICLLAIQTERYTRMGRAALGAGALTKARTFRLAAEGCAHQAFALARDAFPARGAA